MPAAYLNTKYLKMATSILEWAEQKYTAENAAMTRPPNSIPSKQVCPFLKPSLDSDFFYLAFHPEVNGADITVIETLMLSYIQTFKLQPPFSSADQVKKAMLVVFPELPEGQSRILDRVHERIKDKFVEKGLMVAQFHKFCDERSIHNHALKTQNSDYPLMAIRHMQRHDIIFLGENAEWFNWFNFYWAQHFKEQKEPADYYTDQYRIAHDRHRP
jgi:hypothetical protein